MSSKPLLVLAILLSTLACNFLTTSIPTPQPLPTLQPNTVDPNYLPGGATAIVAFTPVPTPTFPATPTPTAIIPSLPEEAILILSPGFGSALTSPVTVSGISNPTFENNLGVQVIGQDGNVLGTSYATIQADIGVRGPFVGTVEFTPPAETQPGRIVVFDTSARDGHIIHLSSVEVTLLAAGGLAEIKPATEQPESISITTPLLRETISGGSLRVAGFSSPTFEQTLSITILDQNGSTVGSGSVIIQSDVGQPGPFEGEVTYTVTETQAGSIQVSVVSPRDGGLSHVSSVEVTLAP